MRGGLLKRPSGDSGWFTSGEHPAADAGSEGEAGEDGDQVGDGRRLERGAEAAVCPCGDGEVGDGGAEQRAEEAERAGGGACEGAAGGAAGAGGREGA